MSRRVSLEWRHVYVDLAECSRMLDWLRLRQDRTEMSQYYCSGHKLVSHQWMARWSLSSPSSWLHNQETHSLCPLHILTLTLDNFQENCVSKMVFLWVIFGGGWSCEVYVMGSFWPCFCPNISTKNDYFLRSSTLSGWSAAAVNLVNGIILIILLQCVHPIDRLVSFCRMFFLKCWHLCTRWLHFDLIPFWYHSDTLVLSCRRWGWSEAWPGGHAVSWSVSEQHQTAACHNCQRKCTWMARGSARRVSITTSGADHTNLHPLQDSLGRTFKIRWGKSLFIYFEFSNANTTIVLKSNSPNLNLIPLPTYYSVSRDEIKMKYLARKVEIGFFSWNLVWQ